MGSALSDFCRNGKGAARAGCSFSIKRRYFYGVLQFIHILGMFKLYVKMFKGFHNYYYNRIYSDV